MKRALWALAALAMFELAAFGGGWKYCGDVGWAVAFMVVAPVLLWPWMLLTAAVVFFASGIDVVNRYLSRPVVALTTFFTGCVLSAAIAYVVTHSGAEGCNFSW